MLRLFVFGLSFFILSSVSYAEKFEKLNKRYLTLRNTDTQMLKSKEWMSLVEDLETFRQKSKKKVKESGRALFYIGSIHEEIYFAYNDSHHLERALEAYSELPQSYAGHDLADDALIRSGNLQLFEKQDKEVARNNFLEVIRAYPESDMVTVARAKIESLDKGKKSRARKPMVRFSDKDDRERRLVLIDPGHGGEDNGAVGEGGLLEKDVVLDIALKLKRLFENSEEIELRLTRRGDDFVPLKERTSLANTLEADLFVSLHVNSSERGRLSGLETYYLDNTNDASSKKLAERENQYYSSTAGMGDLSFMLSDLIQNAKLDDSIVFANVLQELLVKSISTKWGKQKSLGVKKAPFYVLVGAHMPCVLVELFFINNFKDEKKLANSEFRMDVARALALGIEKYFSRWEIEGR